jgi:hypothetical protein
MSWHFVIYMLFGCGCIGAAATSASCTAVATDEIAQEDKPHFIMITGEIAQVNQLSNFLTFLP